MVNEGQGFFGSATDNYSIRVDATPPTLSIASPASGAKFNLAAGQTTANVTFNGNASAFSGFGMKSLQFYEAGTAIGTAGTTSVTASKDLAAGTHTIELRGVDTREVSQSVYVTVIVAPPPPTISFAVPSAGTEFPISTGTTYPVNIYGVAFVTAPATLSSIVVKAGGNTYTPTVTKSFSQIADLPPGDHDIWIEVTDSFGSFAKSEVRRIKVLAAAPRAEFIRQTAPPTMVEAGSTHRVAITMKNSGYSPWLAGGANPTRLASMSPADNMNWGLNRVSLPSDVAVGAEYTFDFNVTAPSDPGTYDFQWMMLREGLAVFGFMTDKVAVQVVQTAPAVTITSHSDGMTVGAGLTGKAVLNLAGNAVPKTGIAMRTLQFYVDGQAQLPVGTTNATASVELAVGSHVIELIGTDERGVSGSQKITVSVSPGPTVTISEPLQNSYLLITSGTTYPLTVRGTAVAGSPANLSNVVVFINNEANQLGPVGTVDFQKELGVGDYAIAIQATDSNQAYGTSEVRQIKVVNGSAGNAAKVESQVIPTQVRPGEPFAVKVVMRNMGTTTWSAGGSYRLGVVNSSENQVWSPSASAYLSAPVAPGQLATFNVEVTAPQQAGTYAMQWQMVRDSVEWFGQMTSNVQVAVTVGPGPTSTLSVTPTSSQVNGLGFSSLKFTGNGKRVGGTVTKLELMIDSGLGYEAPFYTLNGPAAESLDLNWSINRTAGSFRYKLRATDQDGKKTDSAPVYVNVISSGLKGQVTGISQNAAQVPQLVGWVCQPGTASGLNYQVYLNAPGNLGGKQLATGVANVSGQADDAAVQGTCGTTGSSHHFVVDLGNFTSQYAGSVLYVEAQDTSGNTIVLPCGDNSCTMPGSLRIALSSPVDGKHTAANTAIFLRAVLANGTGPYDEVAFSVNGGAWQAGQPDQAADAYFLNAAGLPARAEPYPVQARVRQGNMTLYSATNMLYVDAAAQAAVAVTSPTNGSTVSVNTPTTLSATVSGTTSVAKVKFTVAGAVINATGGGDSWTAPWTPSATGAVTITADVYDANDVLLTSSTAINVTVAVGSGTSSETPIAVSIAAPHQGNLIGGTLPGDLDVGNSGAASYSIPLVVPPGTAGVQPSLSLNYNSQANNGLLGIGWSLGGTSSIHRCGKTFAQDGVNERISFSSTDRLCLDGQRLVLVNLPLSDANYWSSNAEFRTEIDSFSRITRLGNGFKVEAKDGRVMTYGIKPDGTASTSRVAAVVGPITAGTAVCGEGVMTCTPAAKPDALSWAVDSTKDRSGNFISYEYEQDMTSGEHTLSTIRYGGNGLSPHAAVKLTYAGDRKDNWKRYVDQARNDLRQRISKITTYVGANLSGDVTTGSWVREYAMDYEYSPTSGRSMLKSVGVCAHNVGTNARECLPLTTFSWGKPAEGAVAGFAKVKTLDSTQLPILTTHDLYAEYHADYFAMSDFENHGLTDILEKRVAGTSSDPLYPTNPIPAGTMRSSYRYFHNKGAAQFDQYSYRLSTNESFVVLEIGDFNGDGAPDLVAVVPDTLSPNGQKARICLSPLGQPGGLGAPGSTITFDCNNNLAAVGSNWQGGMPFVIDVKGNGKAALYSKARRNDAGRYVATLCIDTVCAEDTSPPVAALGVEEQEPGAFIQAPQNFVAFEQMVDFAGTGKSATVLWPRPLYVSRAGDGESGTVPYYQWFNVTPTVLIPGFKPGIGSTANDGGLKSYVYAPRGASNCTSANNCTRPNPYDFHVPSYSTGVAADFNGSGYSGVTFGYTITNVPDGQPNYYDTAEFTQCLSTGRELDCSVRRKYSGNGTYQIIRAVGNFVGDGMPGILMEKLISAGTDPSGSGELQMCRLYGDDTTGGAGTNDANMVCSPWAGPFPRQTADPADDKIMFLDMLGTGRSQMVIYHPGKFVGSAWMENGTWDIYEPTDVAVPDQALDRIYQVTNGLGSVSTVTYADGVATGLVSQSRTIAPNGNTHVTASQGKFVSTLKRGNGVAGDHTISYAYKDAQVDISGRGSLGFATVTATDDLTGITTTTTYRQDWPYTGMVKSVVTSAGGVSLTTTTNNYTAKAIPQDNGGTTQFVYLSGSNLERADLNGASLGCVQTSGVAYDNWGNLTSSNVVTSDSPCDGSPVKTYTTSTTNTYPTTVDKAHWLVALPQSSSVTRSQSDGPKAITRVTSYTYESDDTGHVKTVTTSTPSSAALTVTTTFDRSGNFGLVTGKTVSWADPLSGAASRTESTAYDSNGRYPVKITNAANHSESRTYDAGTGAATSVTDLNDLKTNLTNDGFGRMTSAIHESTRNATYQYRVQCKRGDGSADTDCPANAAMAVVTEHFNGSARTAVPSVAYTDSIGQPILAKTWGFDGQMILAEQSFDDRTRTYSTNQPHFSGAAAFLAKTEVRDVLGRVISVATKDEQGSLVTTTTEYKGFQRDLTNARGYPRQEFRDAIGRLIKVTDARNGNTLFEYDAFDNLVKTTDPDTNVILVTYDDMGHRTSMADPDLGLITYTVDPIGQVRQQQSPEQKKLGKSTTMTYDGIGRMTARVGPDEDAHWVFDNGTGAKGQLTEAYTLVTGVKDYVRTHSFDSWGRPVTTSTKLFDATYTNTIGYDDWSRVVSTTYQHGSDALKRFDQRYNAAGYLSHLEAGGQRLWTVTSQDAAMRVRARSLGNANTATSTYNNYTALLTGATVINGSSTNLLTLGYQHDAIGDVTQRTQYWNAGSGFTETIEYDELNRIRTSQVTGQPALDYAYTASGGILSKTGVGTGNFQYGSQGLDGNGKNYPRPHAVKSIDGLTGSYSYDDNGNMLSGRGRTMTWTLFDMPKTIASGSYSSAFAYGPERQRTRETRADGGKIVFGGGQEVELSSTNALVSVKTYWPGGGGFDLDKPSQATVRNWVHVDHLGSVVAMTDANGALKTGDELSYDVWGKRRAGNGAAPAENSALTYAANASDNKGFTGHEMLDQLDLVHMNGRVFDPFIGRFLSGDPIVGDPTDGQNYNRYTYVLNNPTNFTDPTGFDKSVANEKTLCDQILEEKKVEVKGSAPASPTAHTTALAGGSKNSMAGSSTNNPKNPRAGSANTTPEKNYGDHWSEYKREIPFSGGDGAATSATGYDDWALGKGYMTQEQWNERAGARGAGAAIGVGLVVGGVAAGEVGGIALHRAEGWYLQRVTNSVVANIEADAAYGRAFLSAKELANGPAAANFGKVVERAVAEKVAANPLMSRVLEYTSKPFSKTPDFVSRFGRGVYDVTTKGTKWGADHLQRGYEGTLRLIEYIRPAGFKF